MNAMSSLITRPTLLLAAACLALGGCGTQHQMVESFGVAELTGPMAVRVHNASGSVRIEVDETLPEATIETEIFTSESLNKEELQALVDAINVETALDAATGNHVLDVRTTSAMEDMEHAINVSISLPRCDGVFVDNRDGEVHLYRTSGATTVRNRGGVITLRTDKTVTDPVTLTNVDGNIYMLMPPDSTGAIDLVSLDGDLSYKATGNTTTVGGYLTDETFTATMNGGTNPIICRTNSGDVWLRPRTDPLAYKPPNYVPFVKIAKKGMFTGGTRRWTLRQPEETAGPAPELIGMDE